MAERDYLRVFLHHNSVAQGRVGVGAMRVREFEEWIDACARALVDGTAIREELSRLVETGTPLGRLSAAALLGRMDKHAGAAAFERLAESEGEILSMSGCSGMSAPLSGVASKVLASGVLPSGERPAPPLCLDFGVSEVLCRILVADPPIRWIPVVRGYLRGSWRPWW